MRDRHLVAVLACAIALPACGGGSGAAATPAGAAPAAVSAPASAAASAPATAPAPAAAPASLPLPGDFAAYRRSVADAEAAYERKDLAAFLEHSQRAAAAMPASPKAVYNLACAYAVNGKPDEALAALGRLADLRVYFDVTADPDLASLEALPALAAVRARLEAIKTPVGSSARALSIAERDLIPEGIAHDPATGAFFVSSVHKRKIVRVAPGGKARDFVAEGQHGLWAVLALAVDPPRRALWACSTAVPEMTGYRAEDRGRSALVKLDLASGKLLQKVALAEPGVDHNLNDLAIDAAGGAFVSDAASSAVYALASGAERLEVVVEPGKLSSPQGIALSADGKALYVADYARGVARVDLATREVVFLAPPDDAALAGIDGLRLHRGDLIAIQNGVRPHRVVRLALSPDGLAIRKATVLEMNHPDFNEPTLGVVVQRDLFYVANSQWGSFDKGGVLWPADRLRDPVILRLRLD